MVLIGCPLSCPARSPSPSCRGWASVPSAWLCRLLGQILSCSAQEQPQGPSSKKHKQSRPRPAAGKSLPSPGEALSRNGQWKPWHSHPVGGGRGGEISPREAKAACCQVKRVSPAKPPDLHLSRGHPQARGCKGQPPPEAAGITCRNAGAAAPWKESKQSLCSPLG